MKYDIDFLEYDILYNLCYDIIKNLETSIKTKEHTLYSNIIDPFSAIFDASFNNMSLTEWIKAEKIRQIQKTFQNEIGAFHQKLLASIKGWEDLQKGKVIDIINYDKKIIAEVKNKFNTTKGNHKIAIYDDLNNALRNEYKGYTAYYVAILTKNRINREFSPSDNKTNTRRKKNKSIIEIDGKSFYEIITSDKDAIYKIYKTIPHILSDILKYDNSKIVSDPLFEQLFTKAFK